MVAIATPIIRHRPTGGVTLATTGIPSSRRAKCVTCTAAPATRDLPKRVDHHHLSATTVQPAHFNSRVPDASTTLHIKTSLVRSDQLSNALGCNVWLKMENEQPSGSFKMRGVGTACVHAVQQHNARCLVASSGGNAGQAVAVAGERLGVPTAVFVPATTSELAIDNMRRHGANVQFAGSSLDDAIAAAQEHVQDDPSAVFIPPFDHPSVFEGNGTIVDEVLMQLREADAGLLHGLMCSVGGGGLFTGMVERLHFHGLTSVPLLTVETQGAASLTASIKAKKLVTLDTITTIATTLGAKRVARRAFDAACVQPTFPMVVTDREAVEACLAFLDATGVVVEPACGAALAPLYLEAMRVNVRAAMGEGILNSCSNLVVIVCGGTTASEDMLRDMVSTMSEC